MSEQYEAAAGMWNQLRREFLYAAEQAEDAERDAGLPKKRGSLLWRSFWASHQRFFRHMCMAAKVLPTPAPPPPSLFPLHVVTSHCWGGAGMHVCSSPKLVFSVLPSLYSPSPDCRLQPDVMTAPTHCLLLVMVCHCDVSS